MLQRWRPGPRRVHRAGAGSTAAAASRCCTRCSNIVGPAGVPRAPPDRRHAAPTRRCHRMAQVLRHAMAPARRARCTWAAGAQCRWISRRWCLHRRAGATLRRVRAHGRAAPLGTEVRVLRPTARAQGARGRIRRTNAAAAFPWIFFRDKKNTCSVVSRNSLERRRQEYSGIATLQRIRCSRSSPPIFGPR